MTGSEAIPKIGLLLSDLINRVKDKQTATLVSQVQTLFQTLQRDYLQAAQDLITSSREALKTERQHAEAMKELESRYAQLQEEHKNEKASLIAHNASLVQENATLVQENAKLIAQNQAPVRKPLAEGARNILLYLFRRSSGARESMVLAASGCADNGVARFHLGELLRQNLVAHDPFPNNPLEDAFIITQKGRQLVMEAGLLEGG